MVVVVVIRVNDRIGKICTSWVVIIHTLLYVPCGGYGYTILNNCPELGPAIEVADNVGVGLRAFEEGFGGKVARAFPLA